MLEPIKHILDVKRIVLASCSPRRSEILRSIGLRFEVVPSLFEENLNLNDYPGPGEFAMETAYRKVLDVSERLKTDHLPPEIIIAADTVVTLDGKIYGKPEDSTTAQQYLEELSGRMHTVYTGVVIKTPSATVKFVESTNVFMAYLNTETIRSYVRTREPMDKAGGYGIQGYGGSIIEKLNGDFYTVMGLPLHSLCKHLLWLHGDFAGKAVIGTESLQEAVVSTGAVKPTLQSSTTAAKKETVDSALPPTSEIS